MKWTKRGNEWNIVFCKSYFLKNDTDDEIMLRTFFEDFALRNVTVRFSLPRTPRLHAVVL